jgi:hypothetical protein
LPSDRTKSGELFGLPEKSLEITAASVSPAVDFLILTIHLDGASSIPSGGGS